MIMQTPITYFITAGASDGFTILNAFDGALLNAGVENVNLIKISSICPSNAREISPVKLPQGNLVPVAYGAISSKEAGDVISADIAIALPEDKDYAGLIMEYSAKGSKESIEQMVRKMAEEGMKMRKKPIKEIKSIAIEHQVKKCG